MRRPTLGLIRAAISHYYDEWETCTPHQTCHRCNMSAMLGYDRRWSVQYLQLLALPDFMNLLRHL